ncbi:hypothetical protein [Burkholderia glumae]|uniref:hypothetical protein n=1 Tax=Burkholderia glumae TaxID=337 RepID=UPI0003068C41|nr:hypothetical protein [Burkholderia glumae]KHJ63040.1 hypothetical protein NCPPB3923_10295 [Burkholderia glumae]MCM2540091.1 hypothetical protein [Burkholderia glumae]MCM2551690.1 hypothetical protein [Burkholderia glumae]MCQ0033907.1 hypothetical protein [Burkholderia glumae]MCQ0038707.1 hypothetical protein [Burkholderia glumae]
MPGLLDARRSAALRTIAVAARAHANHASHGRRRRRAWRRVPIDAHAPNGDTRGSPMRGPNGLLAASRRAMAAVSFR